MQNSPNLYINYPTMLLLKVKVTPKYESKLYNYNKILNTKSKLLFLSLLYYYIIIYYIKILPTIGVIVYSCTMKEIKTIIHR